MTQTSVVLPPGWEEVYVHHLDGRSGSYVEPADSGCHPTLATELRKRYPAGIYRHQALSASASIDGADVCLTTTTASGKSLAFQIAGLDDLLNSETSRVLAIYPQKALGNQQLERWTEALAWVGLPAAGLIDGSVATTDRLTVLRGARVVVMTPDVIHAWLLNQLATPEVRSFLAALRLIVVDEVHSYTGVFGSNAAMLFRRLQHAQRLLGGKSRFFVSSATIHDPASHVRTLLGREPVIVGSDADGSPRHPTTIRLVQRPLDKDLLGAVEALIQHAVSTSNHRVVAFVDSRKMAEQIAHVAARRKEDGVSAFADALTDGESFPDCLPYRAGYEAADRRRIEEALHDGSLRAVVSTSALELGIDVPDLSLAILVGVPRSATTLSQRIGRVGRNGPGEVLVLNRGDVYDEAVFKDPAKLLDRPPAEAVLYLDNPRIQYIHAMCIAREGGEHQSAGGGEDLEELGEDGAWPAGFVDLCRAELAGEIPPDLEPLRIESGGDPNHAFPLRDVEAQFRIEERIGATILNQRGSLSFSQLLREAYPGAIYLYMTQPLRVIAVSVSQRLVVVRRERHYYTSPIARPVLVRPDLTPGSVLSHMTGREMSLVESRALITESVEGFRERRGSNESRHMYPLQGAVTYRGKWFTRNYSTTGVFFAHPQLNQEGVGEHGVVERIAELLFESLLLLAPFERQDLGWAVGRYKGTSDLLPAGGRIVAIYDQTYGSLRLSRRLLDQPIRAKLISTAIWLEEAAAERRGEVLDCLRELASAMHELQNVPVHGANALPVSGLVRVLATGSKGIDLRSGNAEITILSCFYSPVFGGPAYRYEPVGFPVVPGQRYLIPAASVEGIPGESTYEMFDPDTGEFTPDTGAIT